MIAIFLKIFVSTMIWAQLPDCFERPSDLKKVQLSLQKNRNTAKKYAIYQELLKNESSQIQLLRLIYAETLAARCPQQQKEVSSLIILVLQQRLQKRHNDIVSVIYQKDQFASSLNFYEGSFYLDFLCPKDKNIWEDIQQQWKKPTSSTRNAQDVVHYFLYKHHPDWKKEPWTYPRYTHTTPALAECLLAFYNPEWK